VGLLLGTGKYNADSSINYYYKYRIDAVISVMRAKKIGYLIISGDNSRSDYDEPSMMRADLINAGIDSSRIFLDYAGFRTFDSIVRAREVFGQTSITVISQHFHNQRAVFIAGREGISAIGFNARDVSAKSGFKVVVREKLARVKVFADYLLGNKPRFLGPKIIIPE
jgi:SanA protein